MVTLEMQGRRWEIFLSSVELFSRNGYENVSVRDIAASNGMRAPSLYNHFPSKEAILCQMYEFYCQNVIDAAPDLESVLDQIPEKTPNEILHLTMSYYSEELQPIMDKIYIISVMQSYRDPRAYEIIWKYNIEHSKDALRTVLQSMIEHKKIEPLDIEIFLELFVSFAFTTIFRNRSANALGLENWMAGLDMLFSLAKQA